MLNSIQKNNKTIKLNIDNHVLIIWHPPNNCNKLPPTNIRVPESYFNISRKCYIPNMNYNNNNNNHNQNKMKKMIYQYH